MKAVILNVGDEVLEGRVINTNGSFLTSNLLKLGIHTDKVVTIGDDRENLQKEITSFMKSDNDLLITTGGLGPTHDDFTKEVLVETLGLDMIINQEAEELLHKYFGENFAECNLKQAYFPQEAIIIPNKLGTADGAIIEKDKKLYIILVGPPFEMNPMFDDFVKPYLKNKVAIDFLIKEYIVMGIGESAAEEILKPLYDKYHMVNIAPYASLGKIRYQITGSYRFENDFNSACSEFKEILFSYIISENNEDIEEKVVEELRRLHFCISFGESCTGGLLASKIVNVSGASEVFKESIVTYSNSSKTKYLGVKEETLQTFGAVSSEVVYEMAEGLYKLTKSDVCATVSGIAGPSGGSLEKPVGLVYCAIKINDDIIIDHKIFKGGREQIRNKTCLWVLFQIYQKIKAI